MYNFTFGPVEAQSGLKSPTKCQRLKTDLLIAACSAQVLSDVEFSNDQSIEWFLIQMQSYLQFPFPAQSGAGSFWFCCHTIISLAFTKGAESSREATDGEKIAFLNKCYSKSNSRYNLAEKGLCSTQEQESWVCQEDKRGFGRSAEVKSPTTTGNPTLLWLISQLNFLINTDCFMLLHSGAHMQIPPPGRTPKIPQISALEWFENLLLICHLLVCCFRCVLSCPVSSLLADPLPAMETSPDFFQPSFCWVRETQFLWCSSVRGRFPFISCLSCCLLFHLIYLNSGVVTVDNMREFIQTLVH